MLSWQVVDCPVCPSKTGQKCRTLKTGRTTDTHTPRIDRYHELRRRQREQERDLRRSR